MLPTEPYTAIDTSQGAAPADRSQGAADDLFNPDFLAPWGQPSKAHHRRWEQVSGGWAQVLAQGAAAAAPLARSTPSGPSSSYGSVSGAASSSYRSGLAASGAPPSRASTNSHSTASTRGRGSYSRTLTVGQRGAWKTHVRGYMNSVNDGSILSCAVCDPHCVNSGACGKLVTLAAVEHAAFWSFSVAPDTPLEDDDAAAWGQVVRNHAANQKWFDAARSALRTSPGETPTLVFALGSQAVCWRSWGHFHGVNATTMQRIYDKVRRGEQQWSKDSTKVLHKMQRKLQADLTEASTSWWYIRLQYYEFRTKQGVIAHPRSIHWGNVYDLEFVPFMRLCGYNWTEPKKDTSSATCASKAEEGRGSRATWYKGRTHALRRLGDERLGGKAFQFISRQQQHQNSRFEHTIYLQPDPAESGSHCEPPVRAMLRQFGVQGMRNLSNRSAGHRHCHQRAEPTVSHS